MPRKIKTGVTGASAVAFLAVLSLVQPASARNGAQSPNATPTFEVASVRVQPQESAAGGIAGMLAQLSSVRFEGNRFRVVNMTAARLILEAYGPEYRQRDQIEGGPGWLDQERFQIEALAPAMESPRTGSAVPEAVRGMLRNLLETRFNLRVSRETRERPVYTLVRARTDGRLGEGIRASKEDCSTSVDLRPGEPGFRKHCLGQLRINGIQLVGRPIDELVRFLTSRVGRPVIDETGLTGTFDVELFYDVPKTITNSSPAGTAEFSSGISNAVPEKLGLKLEPRIRPTPMLLIQHIERPSPN